MSFDKQNVLYFWPQYGHSERQYGPEGFNRPSFVLLWKHSLFWSEERPSKLSVLIWGNTLSLAAFSISPSCCFGSEKFPTHHHT